MNCRVFLNGRELQVQEARVSAFPFNRVWPGKQREKDQTERTEFVSFDLEERNELEIRDIPIISMWKGKPRSNQKLTTDGKI